MKEHEADVMPSVENSSATLDSTAIDESLNQRLGCGEGETEGFLAKKDQVEDMMVDVVGSDTVEDDHWRAGASFDSNTVSEPLVEECTREETETPDLDMEEVAGSPKDCETSAGIRVLSFEKAEVMVNEEEVAGSADDCSASVGSRVLTSEKAEVMLNGEGVKRSAELIQGNVASRSNGDIAVIDGKELKERSLIKEAVELHLESVQEMTDGKIAGTSLTTANLVSQEVDLVVMEGLACKDEAEGTDKVDERSKEDSLHPTNEVTTEGSHGNETVESPSREPMECCQEVADAGHVVNEKIVKENEVLDSSNISEQSSSLNPGFENVDVVVVVDEGLASKEEAQVDITVNPSLVYSGDRILATGEGDSKVESFHPANEVTKKAENGTVLRDSKLAEKDQNFKITANTEPDVEQGLQCASERVITEHPEEHLRSQEADVEQGPESASEPVLIEHQEENLESREADMEQGLLESSSDPVQIELQEENLKSLEADVDHGLPKTSSEPVVIKHREEYLTSPKPIVYGRRVHVEVPLYNAPDENTSPVLEDEILEVETDSEEDDESVQDERNVVEQSPELLENVSSLSLHQSCYFQPPENEGEFTVSDLVWGKVRSHPWWPGQIIDPSDASKKAMKYHKKDCFLVAYFGDHSFAWNNSSVLKPFRENFSRIEKQTNLESFKIAVQCALEEVTRRVELGLACSCVSQDIYKKIEYQVIENGGVRKKASRRPCFDESAGVSSFEPDKLVDYVRLLAQFPSEGDKLELAMAKAQLSSYGRYKGYQELPEFWFSGDLLEDAPICDGVEQVRKDSEKSENNLIESSLPNKEISLSDITDDAPESGVGTSRSVSSSGLKKRKARVSISNGSVKRQNRNPNKVSPSLISTLKPNKVSPALISTSKPSFRVGEVIQRLASQLTGPPTLLKSNSDKIVEHGQHVDQIVGSPVSLQTPENLQREASVAEMLSQLHSTAQDPMKDYTFLQTIIPFFYERRAAVFTKSLKKHSTNEKPVNVTKKEAPSEQDPEEFEFVFDDVNDSYWTDRIVQNQSEEQLLQDNQNGGTECQVVAFEQDKPAKRRRRSKKTRILNHEVEPEEVEEESEVVQQRRQNLATEIVLKFTEGVYFPSEINLNKMFRRFGPLMESETEVDRQGGRARVVFKRCSDAEVAHSSAKNFNIFGPIDVNYELNYTPLVSYKPLPVSLLQDPMDAS